MNTDDKSSNNEIDSELLDGERTIPSVTARKRPPIAVIGVVLVLVIAAIGLLMMANKGDRKQKLAAQREEQETKRETTKAVGKPLPKIDFAALAEAEEVPAQPVGSPTSDGNNSATPAGAPPLPGNAGNSSGAKDDREAKRDEREAEKRAKEAAEEMRQRRESSPMVFSKAKGKKETAGDPDYDALIDSADKDSEENELNVRLKPTKVSGSRAGVLPNRNFMLTKGHFLGCSLEQAINSTLAGMLSCRLNRDVYSTNRKVLLMERGSLITGEYQRGLTKGQARIFVLWTRVETPLGVVVDIGSPGTDALGRSGIDGYVNRHFFERFGSAIFLSVIDDVGQFAVAKAQEGDTNQINFGGTTQASQDMAAEALKYSIDIPPTLEKNQGGDVSIYVARDLDFSDVYTLAAQ